MAGSGWDEGVPDWPRRTAPARLPFSSGADEAFSTVHCARSDCAAIFEPPTCPGPALIETALGRSTTEVGSWPRNEDQQIAPVAAALDTFGVSGGVLELAGGTGWWTERLAYVSWPRRRPTLSCPFLPGPVAGCRRAGGARG